MTFALFGIQNDGLNLAVNLLVFFLFVIWLALVYWTYADATPAAGRPDADRLRDGRVAVPVHRHDRLHDRAPARVPRGRARARARDQGRRGAAARCSRTAPAATADSEIEPSFLRCPSCMRKLKEPCRSCGKPLDPRWRVCPYCEAEVAGRARDRAQRRAGGRRPARDDRRRRAARASDRARPERHGRTVEPRRGSEHRRPADEPDRRADRARSGGEPRISSAARPSAIEETSLMPTEP